MNWVAITITMSVPGLGLIASTWEDLLLTVVRATHSRQQSNMLGLL